MKLVRICLAMVGLAVIVAVVGCSRPTEPAQSLLDSSAQPASFREGSPEDYLSSVLTRYRSAASYRDDGRAQIRYLNGKNTETRVAPLRFWFDRNELYLETYDVRLTSDPEGLTAWIADPSSENFDSQVLKARPLVGRPKVDSLLADPILAGRVAAGLAGPPPQLEWLFSPEPMKRLFQPDHRFSFGSTRTIEGQSCRSVQVDADGQVFQFWIDERSAVIRRVDLPPIVAPMRPGETTQTIEISIDLVGATFDVPDQAPAIERLPPSPKWLTRFVPLPPPQPSRVLGKQLPNFSSDREVTACVRLSSNPGKENGASLVQAWFEHLPEDLQAKIRVTVLKDTDADLAAVIELSPDGVVLIDRNGVIAWVEPSIVPGNLAAFGAIVGDIVAGVDVPKQVAKQWSEQVAIYQSKCREATIRRN